VPGVFYAPTLVSAFDMTGFKPLLAATMVILRCIGSSINIHCLCSHQHIHVIHTTCCPQVKPGCILRRSNFNVLEREELVTGKQVDQCKKRMNTFGFVGDLSKDPEVSCVYHSEEAENQ
jgi:hypothetical protein